MPVCGSAGFDLHTIECKNHVEMWRRVTICLVLFAAVMQQLDHCALCEIESFTGHGMHGDPFQQGAGAQHKVRRVRSIPHKLRCTEGQDWPLWP
jgi:hypothetical protein